VFKDDILELDSDQNLNWYHWEAKQCPPIDIIKSILNGDLTYIGNNRHKVNKAIGFVSNVRKDA